MIQFRFRMLCLAFVLAFVFADNHSQGGFVLSLDSADLEFSGVGPVVVPVLITHDGIGPSTLSGYSFQFEATDSDGNAALAADDIVTNAVEGLPIGAGLGSFQFVNAANTVQSSDFDDFDGVDLTDGGTGTLFSLELTVGSAAEYVVQVDFQNGQRGLTAINGEFSFGAGFDTANATPGGVGLDTTFTLTNVVAVPEPTTFGFAFFACTAFCTLRRRTVAR
jgi:hypothetical protein